MSFTLHPQLAADTHMIGDLPLCRVLLMNNANFPWLILVPKKASLRELFDLAPDDYVIAMQEVRMIAETFKQCTGAYKMNIAALGNMVPQLHIHIIAREQNDAAWPSPVWNYQGAPRPYTSEESAKILPELRAIFGVS